MTKAEIVSKVSNNLGLDKNEVLATVENLMEEIKGSLNNGENVYLTDNIHAARIRTALFAGVRSTILWRQLGGSKLKLFINKRKYSNQIDMFLNSIKN